MTSPWPIQLCHSHADLIRATVPLTMYNVHVLSCREGYRLENLSRAQLERKLELCRNYCQIFSILEPGTHGMDNYRKNPLQSMEVYKTSDKSIRKKV